MYNFLELHDTDFKKAIILALIIVLTKHLITQICVIENSFNTIPNLNYKNFY
jgi:hypothetical protein